jgi:arsenite methyltransferase
MTASTLDIAALETKVKAMYRAVAEEPHGRYHFEMGRDLADRLGYPADVLDRIPAGAVESFAGVGYFFDLAAVRAGDTVLDLGSGSGMDAFVAALQAGTTGRVVGIDMTREQLAKAERLRRDAADLNVRFEEGHIERLPYPDETFDLVISNGVINLAPDKRRVFEEAARVLRPGGRLAIADIVSELPLSDQIVCNADLWAACIGGAAQQDDYQQAVEAAGCPIELVKRNPYGFRSGSARGASQAYGVHSLSLLARKPA